jgi:hypothetical protein
MTRRTAAIDDAILTTTAATTRAAAAALRRTREAADDLPLSRAFASIATLCEFTERIEDHLVAGHRALSSGDTIAALPELDRARALAGGAMIEARPEPTRQPIPKYLVKRR